MKLKRLLHYSFVPALVLLLSNTVAVLHAQNTLNVSSFTVFLNGVVAGPPVQQTVSLSSTPVTAVPVTATFSNAGWLSVTPSTGSTPVTLTLTANPAGLNAGVYSTTLAVASSNATSVNIAVVFTVNAAGTPLVPSPANLTFTYQPGAPLPPAQTINVSGSTALPFVLTPLNATWLLLGQSGTSITVAVSPGSLTPGIVYVGGIQIAAGGQPPVIVPVALYYFPSPQISVSSSTLTFNYQIGAGNNIVQKSITVSPASTTFSATATVPAGTVQWLAVSPSSGSGTLSVNVLPAGLPVGTYQGKVTISATGANPVDITVTLNVSAQPLLDLSTNALSFTYQVGTSNPASQSVTPTTTTTGLPYTVAASSQGNWLSVSVGSAVTPNPVTVSVNPAGLPAGSYTGTITFNAVGASNNPQTVTVTLTVTNNPTFTASPNPVVFNYEIGQSVPANQTIQITSAGSPLTFTAAGNGTSNNINWLLIGTATSNTTPAALTIGVNPASLPAGTYNGSVVFTSAGSNAQLSVPVVLNVSTVALLNLPTSISFNSVSSNQPGQQGPSQTVTVTSTGEAVTYTVVASTTTPAGFNWLVVGTPSGAASSTVPSSFIVAANPTGLQPGVYTGSLLVHPSNGNPDVTIPVTYTVTAGNLTVSPATLNFTQAAGGPPSPAQNVTVSTSGSPLNFSVLTNVSTSVNWLTVSPTAGTTPGTIAVSASAGSLQPGNYTGTVTIASPNAGNSPQTVTVNLTVGQPQNINVTPMSLNFGSQFQSPAPASQTIAITASTGSLPFSVAAATTNGPQGWLSATPTSGTATQTPTNVTVSVNPQGLNVGTYNGTLTITGQNASNGAQTVNVTYTVTAIPTPVPTRVQNAGDGSIGPVAPGEIISIFGTNLGPATGVTTTVSATGFFATTLSETQVLFDNIPAAMWYTSATQINAIVPYEIAGRATTTMQVIYRGTPSTSLNLQVAPAAPGFFLIPGTTQAASINQNGTINGLQAPAPRNTSIVLYATGEGPTTPAGVTGRVIPLDPNQLKHPVAPVTVTIGGRPAEVQYVGSAPGFVSGALQVNVLIPADAPTGGAVAVVMRVGGIANQGLTTIAVQ
jgi:uncharacterized protein (TIGR03437 family)